MSAKYDTAASTTSPHSKHAGPGETRSGLVIVNYGKNQLIEDGADTLYRCVARRGLPQMVCGDTVEWRLTGDNTGVVEAIKPRQSVMLRADGNNTVRPLVANIDQIIIEAALEPALDYFMIDKYIIAAELARTVPLIVINKSDLMDRKDHEKIQILIEEYREIGYSVSLTSALKNTGIESFAAQLSGKTSVLVGQSGVGKSSIIKRLLPNQAIIVGKLSAASGLGKHTTTSTTLYHLPQGGRLIDSPGVRDFHLGDIDRNDLEQGFREFHAYRGQCKFNDCRHLSEPGCVITAAVDAGKILKRRMESYRQLMA